MVGFVKICMQGKKRRPLLNLSTFKIFLDSSSFGRTPKCALNPGQVARIKHTSAGDSKVNMCPQLLAVLAGCDLVYLVTMLLESIRKFGLETRSFIPSSPISMFASISFFSRLHLLLIPYLFFPLNAISMMASVYMTLALAVERFPFQLDQSV